MGIRIDRLQAAILEATATEARAKATITALREVLDTEARRRFQAEGAAPTWKSALGAIRFDAPGEWSAQVADPARFGSYVAERHPGEATAAIHVNADDLDDALTALGFVNVDVLEARVDVRTAFRDKYLEGLLVDVEETAGEDGTVDRVVTIVDPTTGELVDGVSATRTNAGGKLVVTLDRKAKAAALEAAKGAASEAIAAATGEPPAAVEAGRTVTLDEVIASGAVRPASELTAPERAAVERFEEAPDALAEEHPTAEGLAVMGGRLVGHRLPYVGEGADGARRSAEIDRTEAEGLDPFADAERYADVMRSAERWEAQAAELEAAATEPEEPTRIPVDDRDHFTGQGPHGNASTVSLEEALAMQDPALKLAEENNRETLRRICRAKGIPAGGGKLDLAARIVEAGGV